MADYTPRFVPQNAPLNAPTKRRPESKAAYDARIAKVIPTGDEPYAPPVPMSQVPGDIGKSLVTGATDLAEGTAGYLGDRFSLAKLINDYFKDKSGMDLGAGINQAEQYSTKMPTTENVQDYVTNPLLEQLPLGATDWARHEPQSPWGQAAYAGTQFLDPTESLGPASKFGRFAKRAF